MEVRASLVSRLDAIGKHFDDFVKMLALEVTEWIGTPKAIEEDIFFPFVSGDCGDDLLGENIQRRVWNFNAIQNSATHGANQRHAFDQLVPRQWEHAAL